MAIRVLCAGFEFNNLLFQSMALNKCYRAAAALRVGGVSRVDIAERLRLCIAEAVGGAVGGLTGEAFGGENVVSQAISGGLSKIIEGSGGGGENDGSGGGLGAESSGGVGYAGAVVVGGGGVGGGGGGASVVATVTGIIFLCLRYVLRNQNFCKHFTSFVTNFTIIYVMY